MRNNMTRLNFLEILIVILLFSHGFRELCRGFFWTKEQEKVLSDSDFYVALDQLMPIWLWGLSLVVFGLMIILASVFVTSYRYNNNCATLLFAGGFGSFIVYLFLTSGSMYNSINWLTTAQLGIMAGTSLILSFIGGVRLIAKRKR